MHLKPQQEGQLFDTKASGWIIWHHRQRRKHLKS